MSVASEAIGSASISGGTAITEAQISIGSFVIGAMCSYSEGAPSSESEAFTGQPNGLILTPGFGTPTLIAGGLEPSLSIGSVVIGGLPLYNLVQDASGFEARPISLALAIEGGLPSLIATNKEVAPTLSIGSMTIGYLSSDATAIPTEQDYIQTPIAAEMSVICYTPTLITGSKYDFVSTAKRLDLATLGYRPTLVATKVESFVSKPQTLELAASLYEPELYLTADFPPPSMTSFYDSSKYSMEQNDPADKVKTDGGYTITRPKYLSKPKMNFKVEFTNIGEMDKKLLEDFWNDRHGSTEPFTFKTPIGKVVTVRFTGPMTFTYVGMGETALWNVTGIALRQV